MAITIQNSNLSATINEKGAELTSLRSAAGKEYMWDGNPAFWGKHSPVLFPIVGTLKDNSYSYNEQRYELSRHGFARDMVFTLEASGADFATFVLKSNEETLEKYPFHFRLCLHYTLKEHSLEIKYTVENKGQDDMLFSIGAHPAFALNGSLDDYAIKIDHQDQLHYNLLRNDLMSYETEELEMTKGVLPLCDSLFERDALIIRHTPCRSLSLLRKGKAFLTVDFNDFEDLGIWKKTGAGFICIEPWLGYSDPVDACGNLKDKPGIQTLEKGKAFEAAFQITIL